MWQHPYRLVWQPLISWWDSTLINRCDSPLSFGETSPLSIGVTAPLSIGVTAPYQLVRQHPYQLVRQHPYQSVWQHPYRSLWQHPYRWDSSLINWWDSTLINSWDRAPLSNGVTTSTLAASRKIPLNWLSLIVFVRGSDKMVSMVFCLQLWLFLSVSYEGCYIRLCHRVKLNIICNLVFLKISP